MINLTFNQFQTCTQSHVSFAERYWPYAQTYMVRYGIQNNVLRCAAFLATISIESDRLEQTEESLYYKDPLRLASIFKRVFDLDRDGRISPEEVAKASLYCRNPAALSEVLYKGYSGRGLIQLTWLANYQKYEKATCIGVVANPKILREPENAMHSACWFWESSGCNEAADTGSMSKVTLKVNGPALMKLKERTDLFHANLHTLS